MTFKKHSASGPPAGSGFPEPRGEERISCKSHNSNFPDPRAFSKEGDWWPRVSDNKKQDQDRAVCPVRETSTDSRTSSVENALVKMESDHRIQFGEVGVGLMTPLMMRRLKLLLLAVSNTKIHGVDSTKLFVHDLYVEPAPRDYNELHFEGRMIDLRFNEIPDGEENQKKVLRILAALCRDAGFEFLELKRRKADPKPYYLHAAVPPQLLVPWFEDERLGVDVLNRDFRRGWKKVEERFSDSGRGALIVEAPEDINRRLILAGYKDSEMFRRIDAFLIMAAQRGLYPKAYSLGERPCSSADILIRLYRSPLHDLASIVDWVSPEGLDMSVEAYSSVAPWLFQTSDPTQGPSLDRIVERLRQRYPDLRFRIHDALKAIPVPKNVSIKPCSCLTNLLDQLAYEVHGMWFWSGRNKIDFVSRSYNLFVGA